MNVLDGILTSTDSEGNTTNLLDEVVASVTGNLDTLLPVGITILAVMIGVSLIPRIVYKFF